MLGRPQATLGSQLCVCVFFKGLACCGVQTTVAQHLEEANELGLVDSAVAVRVHHLRIRIRIRIRDTHVRIRARDTCIHRSDVYPGQDARDA